jgi:hypothetical protein
MSSTRNECQRIPRDELHDPGPFVGAFAAV